MLFGGEFDRTEYAQQQAIYWPKVTNPNIYSKRFFLSGNVSILSIHLRKIHVEMCMECLRLKYGSFGQYTCIFYIFCVLVCMKMKKVEKILQAM